MLLLSQREDILINYPARVPFKPNQKGTREMRDEILSSVRAQNMNTSGYQVSDLEDIEFDWEDPNLNMNAVFQPGIDNLFSVSTFTDFEMGSMTENLILIDEYFQENSIVLPTTPLSEMPTQPPVMMRCCRLGTRIEKIHDHIHRILFEYFISLFESFILTLSCMYFNINYDYCVSFYYNRFQKLVRHV